MNQSLIRAALKIGAGYFIQKGFVDESTAEIIIAGIVALFAVIWGYYHRGGNISNTTGNRLGLLVFVWFSFALLVTGCVVPNPDHKAGDNRPAYVADTNTIAQNVATVQNAATVAAPVVASVYPPAAPAVAIATPLIPAAGGALTVLLGMISGIWATKRSKDAAKNEAAATAKTTL